MSEPNPHLARPVKKRRRPALACEQCRRRKVRCDRGSPCTTCVQTGNKTCSYAAPPRPHAVPGPPRRIRPTPPESSGGSPEELGAAPPSSGAGAKTGTPASSSTVDWVFGRTLMHSEEENGSSAEVDSLAERVRRLESQLGNKASAAGFSKSERRPLRGMLEKTRFFGPSHWTNGVQLFWFLLKIAMKSAERKDEVYAVLCECKTLARVIKSRRQPVLASTAIGNHLVAVAVATPLLETYFSTFELVHRVLHIPSFRRDYGLFLEDPSSVPQSFKVRLQLCMAIGASMRDPRFELRATAIQWVYEGRLWLIMPSEKERISVTGVQVMCLLQIARQAVGVGAEVSYPETGSLVRTAMSTGMHRDPACLPKMTVMCAEVRRRLWATVLEIAVQSSIDSGAPPPISFEDYDTEPPLDVDDDELTDEPEPTERPRASVRHTQTSVQLLLHRHFLERLAVAKFVNDINSKATYDEALRLHERASSAFHHTTRQLAQLVASTSSSRAPVTAFHQRYIEVLIRRFVLALHYPFLPHFADPAYFFSRKVLTDVSRRVASLYQLPAGSTPPSPGAEHFCNLAACSTRFSRLLMQAFVLLGPELVAIKREEVESYGEAGTGGADLKTLLEGGSAWMIQRIRAGETNVKGHMFLEAIVGEADGVVAGLEGEELEKFVLGRMKTALETALATLKEVAKENGVAVEGEGQEQLDLDTSMDFEVALGPADPVDSFGWQLDWEDMTNLSTMSNFLL